MGYIPTREDADRQGDRQTAQLRLRGAEPVGCRGGWTRHLIGQHRHPDSGRG